MLCYSDDAIREGFWCGNVEDGDQLEDLDIDGRILLKSNLKEDGRASAEVISVKATWRAVVKSGSGAKGTAERRGICRLAEELIA